ncbi:MULTISPECIES: alanine/ornithine racemase family PLP-dependent enzyme [Aliivibrio]|nr:MULTISPECIES: alanine/ornithine racemase family PLP-dependent enzyme [Aliivibrio]MBD1569517.1 alanine/ornithine racemase family PLP-dependent enzyme [Aliivibrio sp. S10_S31]MUH96379.1 alanine/ornithine racemase family PLP-dependent enzyme [Aliivibrio fischeri]MUI63949.1 alanine/ornithine racemase family PLP-dependent enzyme [Aliivibrio fischeri]USR94585.1 alanine/ornithine racemase family PLP-dependent enzyme [Aliivibrio fischeri ATCC 7744 = JCM 18803 = DSM 507]GGK43236.1 amino-acid racemas
MSYPRLDINCTKIYLNTRTLINKLYKKGISIAPVTKVCLGNPIITNVLVHAGVNMIADSRIENMDRIQSSGIKIPTILIRSPMISQVKSVIKYCDISLNTEVSVIKKLSLEASKLNVNHGVIVMVELGDLREGVMPHQLFDFFYKIIKLPNILIKGIGMNLACRYGVIPNKLKISQLSNLADSLEKKFNIKLDIISGGNSASLYWALNNKNKTRINHLRLGESIFLGCDSLYQKPIKGLFTDAITLTAEVIESKIKPSLPWGDRGYNAFGEKDDIFDRGLVLQAIIALGRQDVIVTGIKAPEGINIMSSTSDHLVVETNKYPLFVGQKVKFELDYSGLLSSMSSSFVHKNFQNIKGFELPKKQ